MDDLDNGEETPTTFVPDQAAALDKLEDAADQFRSDGDDGSAMIATFFMHAIKGNW